MRVNQLRIEVEIIQEPAHHYNHDYGCDEVYTALVYVNDNPLPKWPCGETREEAKQNVLREFPHAKWRQK